jgi:hypothetical protein
MPKKLLTVLISLTVLPIAVYSIQRFLPNPLGGTSFWWLVQIIILTIFVGAVFTFFRKENRKNFLILTIYLAWVAVCLFRGIFISEIYWDYKALITNTFALNMPLIAYIVTDNQVLQSIFSYFVKFGLLLAIPVLLPVGLGVWAWYLFPILFLLLLLPLMKFNWKIIILMIALVAGLGAIAARSHLMKFGVVFLILSIYYFRFFIAADKIIIIARKVLLFMPWLFFGLAVSGIFNVFNINEYVNVDKKTDVGGADYEDLTADSRSFIYEDVLRSAMKYDYWLLGRSPARGNETSTLGFIKEGMEVTGRKERLRNEANMTNVFTWLGIVGVVLYFLIFYKATYLAIHRSNNIFTKLIGLYVAFRWVYAWVEDYYEFDMNSFTIWVMVGVCFSESFRRMNNLEVKLWVRGIFSKKYSVAYINYALRSYRKELTLDSGK